MQVNFVMSKLRTCKIMICEAAILSKQTIFKYSEQHGKFSLNSIFHNFGKKFWYLHVNARYLLCSCHEHKQHWYSPVVTNLNSICGTVVQWLLLLHNFIQQSLNSGSVQAQSPLWRVGDSEWGGSLEINSSSSSLRLKLIKCNIDG